MNHSYTADSGAQWGVSIPGHWTNTSAPGADASPDLAQKDSHGLFICKSCGKQYTRLCDLTKHFKTHSRPFKCPAHDCRYHDWGWPTEKELDRHYNDKHSTEPRTFSCLWHDCNYSTKRESNCKQHMEKVHGYHYVRSRSGNQEEDTASPFNATRAVKNPFSHPRSELAIRTVPNVLLTASSVDQPSPLAPDSASPSGLEGPSSFSPITSVLWNSPATQLRSNQAFLQEFPHPYHPGNLLAIQDQDWLRVPIDPRLQTSSTGTSTPEYTPTSSASSDRDVLLSSLPTIMTPRTSPIAPSQVLTPISSTSPGQQSGINSEATTPQDVESTSHQERAGVQAPGASSSGYINTYGKRQVRFENDQEDDSEEDDEPPMKRTRAPRGTDDGSGDPRMYCPFRVAHPEIYDVEVHSRYFSCHTEHNNISTVVRHLGRPAHNLEVNNDLQAIHSFNVSENEHGHPAAGLCKKCWRSFTDRAAFDAHTRSKCETASRSKREKFQALIDTFCSTEQDRRNSDINASTDDDAEDAPVSATSSRSQSRIEDVVSRHEYQSLVDRVATLEQMMLAGGMLQANTPRTLPSQQQAVARAFTASPAMPSQAFGYYSFSPATGPSSSTVAGSRVRTSVLAGMDAQSLESGDSSGEHTVSAFYNDANPRIASTPAYRSHTINRRTDSVSTVRPAAASPLLITTGSGSSGSAVEQAGGNPRSTGRAAASDFRADRASAAHLPSQQQHHHHHQQVLGAPVVGEDNAAVVSQQSANTLSCTPWEHAVQVGEEMMRGMDFFNGGQGPGDDLSGYLDMDPQ